MWICATTRRNFGNTDKWSVHETEAEALEALAAAEEEASRLDGLSLYCWAIAPISSGSEPHYVRPTA